MDLDELYCIKMVPGYNYTCDAPCLIDSLVSSWQEHNSGPNNSRRFRGLFYKRKAKEKAKAKIFGKENMVNACNGNMQTYALVYKRRHILGHRD